MGTRSDVGKVFFASPITDLTEVQEGGRGGSHSNFREAQ